MFFIFDLIFSILVNFSVFVKTLPLLCYTYMYEFRNRYGEVLTHLPYELNLRMPATDRDKRGCLYNLVASLRTRSTATDLL